MRRSFPRLVRVSELSRSDVDRALAAGELVRVRHGYLTAPPARDLPASERAIHGILAAAHAVVASARTPVAVSHLSAAMALGCWVYRPPREAHVTQSRQRKGHSGVIPVRRHMSSLPVESLRLSEDVLVTAPARLVVDVARTEPFLRALPVADVVLALGVPREDLLLEVERLGSSRGVRSARAVVELATGRVHALGESVVRGHVILLGLPRPRTLFEAETALGIKELDLAWPEIKVAVEFDGAVKLAGPTGEELTRALNDAAAREAALVKLGWVILHLTWHDLLNVEELRRKLVRLVRYRAI